MKATSIAIMAVSALASGLNAAESLTLSPQEANIYLQQSLTSYLPGSDFTLSFTLENQTVGNFDTNASPIITLGDSYYLVAKASSGIGLSSTSTDCTNKSGATLYSWSNVPSSLVNGANVYTSSAPNLLYGYLNKDSSGRPNTLFAPSFNGTAITISYSAADNTSTIDLTLSDGTRQIVQLVGTALDARDLAFGTKDMTSLSHVSFSTPAVPEPATTTLSLLALAGLAARRRR